MAAHLELKDIKALPVIPYQDIRAELKSGDLLFASGDYLFSKAIQEVSGSPWSHVGIIFKLESLGRILLLESVENMGVRFAPLSKYLTDYSGGKPYKGRVAIGRCLGVTDEVVAGLAAFGIDELTRPYDVGEITNIMARVYLGRGKNERDRQYICSELVYECFSRAGIEFEYDKRGFVSPENIWTNDKVSLLKRVL